ncbi:serralysin family metalloprotease [Pseudomonas gingeri]|uniref:serralysin family metalloprotease n=1 Tax=Pseudomonas gingeri TaxID=117681 RepID=UPI0015A38928|nr:serralysin family metalloprotease [Pseudomonas gingeri]NWA02112.1 M10 family metallopeptidase [Pseudomonas gingeri]NWA12930.1 M10 family metallopeptidase [Pseudomonas gingeri]NWA57672.1 M10 family metallopeptidase [Pseudomonas gingeri]NWA93301.1 M10 family metallopeptidase [Pseudomonas gingeri]NWB02651.1 M10 family metallopeptidase [Pseudomonas gingeri]
MKVSKASEVVNQHLLSTVREFSARSGRGEGQAVNGKPSYSVDQAATNLLNGSTPWADTDGNGKIELTYSFPSTSQLLSNDDYYELGLAGLHEFSPMQKTQAALAMQSWADAANISFSAASRGGDGHITFGDYKVGDGAAQTIRPGDASGLGGQSWYSTADGYEDNKSPALNNNGRQTLTHEIGHALGLPHPGNYNGAGTSYTHNATYAQDTLGYSVMSYWSETSNSQDFSRDGTAHYASAPLMDDIAAIQKLYGANWSTRADDTTYGFNSNTGRDFLSASQSWDALVFCAWDGGGNDTLDFSGFSQNQKINLHAGAFSDVGGMVGNISIAQGVTLENAVGGSGNDLLIGNETANELRGGAGNDILYGAGGADRLWGEAGNDTFVFMVAADSAPGAADRIMDFVSGEDKIDLSGITRGAGLNIVDAFTGVTGETLLSYTRSSHESRLAIDIDGNGVADFMITAVGQITQGDIVV